MPMNFRRVLELLGQRIDRQGRGVGGEDRAFLEQRLGLGIGLGLDLAVLEHGLDDEVAIPEGVVVGRRRDARHRGVAVLLRGAALLDEIVDHALRMGLALVGRGLVAVDQHDVDAGARRDEADAGAHEAGADHGELLHFRRRHARGAPRALVQFLHRQEQRADHRGRFLAPQDLREVARFHAQRRVDRQLQALVDALHDGARGGIVVVGLAAVDRVAGREHHHAGLGEHRTARQLEALFVPGRDRLAAALDPVLRGLDHVGGRHDGVNQVQRLGLVELDRLALEQELHRVLRLHDARHALGAAGAGEQADLDFGQTKPRLRIVGGDAVMAGQRQLEAAAEREAIDRGGPRLARGLDVAEHLREAAALVEQHLVGRDLALLLQRLRIGVAHALQHREIGAGAERFLAGGDDDALHGGISGGLLHDRLELIDRGLVQHVHRAAGNVPGDERNAVGVGFELEILEGHVVLPHADSAVLSIFVGWAKRRRAHRLSRLEWWARRKRAFAHPTAD